MDSKIYPIKLYLRSLPNKIMFGLSLLINLGVWGWLIWHIQPQTEPIFLHYNILFGVDLIGEWWKVYILPATGLIILFVNGLIGWFAYHKDNQIAYFLNFNTIICQSLIAIAAYLLVFLNI